MIFPRLPSNLYALFFALYYSVLSLCSAFFPSLIESSFDSCKVGSSLLLHGQSVRRVLFHSVYSGVIFSAPVDFESICFPFHFSVIWHACFATRPPVLRVYSLAPVYIPVVFYSLLCYSFLAFSAVISHVFLPALPWQPERVFNALVGLLTLRLPSLGWVFLAYSLRLRFSFLPWTFISSLFACCHSRACSLFMFYHAVFLLFPERPPCPALSKYQQSSCLTRR